MRLLQTGDLHLGKIFFEQSLIPDQQHMLNQLLQELEAAEKQNNSFDALIITGDIYDRAIPPPEAVTIFDDFITKAKKDFPELAIVIISGNHDSSRRLSFGSRILSNQNIHIVADIDSITKPIILKEKNEANLSIALYCIPFLQTGVLGKDLLKQQDMIQEAINQITLHKKHNHPEIPAMLCAHLFTKQGKSSDSERIFIGTAEQVDSSVFKDFVYTALGHLHRCQNPAENTWYSGSPLAYSFDEANEKKYFLEINIDLKNKTTVEVQKILVKPIRPVTRLTGTFEEFYRPQKNIIENYKNSILEIICNDSTLIENPMARLKAIFPNLLSFRQEKINLFSNNESMEQRKELLQDNKLATEKLFSEFIKDIYDGTLPEYFEQEKDLYLNIAATMEVQN